MEVVGTNGFDPRDFAAQAKEAGKKAAITMVTFNRWNLTQQSLASIFENTFLPYTLTLVDNGSWDDTREKLKELKRAGKIDRLILLPENRGIAVGKNFGLQASEGKATWYCCIDNDIEVGLHWLSYLCYASTLLNLGVVGSNVQRFSLPGGSLRHKVTPWKAVEGVILDNCPNPGGIYVFSAATFKKLGYFLERGLYGLEDGELCMRQKRHGLRSAYVRNVVCEELPDEKFLMPHGVSYRAFKTATHDAMRAQARGTKERFTHYETAVTLQDVEECTWRP